VINPTATNANASSICEGVRCRSHVCFEPKFI
jgi:hypothetical protein